MSTISKRPKPVKGDSRRDRASVRGVGGGPENRRRPRGSTSRIPRALARFGAGWRRLGLAGVVLVAGVVFAAIVDAVHTYMATSEDFAIREVTVEGQKRAAQAAILRLSGVSVGQNIFAVDTEETARLVEAHPWVARASAKKEYPSRVRIVVEEHEPVVLVSLGHLYYANASGEIVKRYAPGEEERLPVVTGLRREDIETDDGAALAQLRQAIAFLRTLDEVMGEDSPRIGEVHIDPLVGLSFREVGEHAEVVMGKPPWKPRIERLAVVRRTLKDRGMRADRILMDGERRAGRGVVRLAPADPAASAQGGGARSPGLVRGVGDVAPMSRTTMRPTVAALE